MTFDESEDNNEFLSQEKSWFSCACRCCYIPSTFTSFAAVISYSFDWCGQSPFEIDHSCRLQYKYNIKSFMLRFNLTRRWCTERQRRSGATQHWWWRNNRILSGRKWLFYCAITAMCCCLSFPNWQYDKWQYSNVKNVCTAAPAKLIWKCAINCTRRWLDLFI